MRVSQGAGSSAEVDPLDLRGWKEGSIPYGKTMVDVKFVPMGREKLALDRAFRFYWYDTKRQVWRRINQGGMYALRRSFRHMEETHRGEIPTLKRLDRICTTCEVDFADLSDRDFQFDGQVARKAQMLREQIQQLGRVIDEYKVEGREELFGLFYVNFYADNKATLRQRRIIAHTDAAARKFRARIKNIRGIDAWVSYYGMVVEALVLSLEDHLHQAINFLQRAYQATNPRQRQTAWKSYLFHLSFLQYRPFRQAWSHLHSEAERIPLLRDDEEREKLLSTSSMSLQLLRIRSQLDRMKLHLNRKEVQPNIHSKMQQAIQGAIELMEQVQGPFSRSLSATVSQVYPLLHQAKEYLNSGQLPEALQLVDRILNIL